MRYILLFISVLSFYTDAQESVCYGTTSKGSLTHGVELPSSGTKLCFL